MQQLGWDVCLPAGRCSRRYSPRQSEHSRYPQVVVRHSVPVCLRRIPRRVCRSCSAVIRSRGYFYAEHGVCASVPRTRLSSSSVYDPRRVQPRRRRTTPGSAATLITIIRPTPRAIWGAGRISYPGVGHLRRQSVVRIAISARLAPPIGQRVTCVFLSVWPCSTDARPTSSCATGPAIRRDSTSSNRPLASQVDVPDRLGRRDQVASMVSDNRLSIGRARTAGVRAARGRAGNGDRWQWRRDLRFR